MLLSFTCAVFCVFLLMGFILSYGCIPVYTRLLMNLCAVSTLGPPCIKAAVNLCMQSSFASGFFFFFFLKCLQCCVGFYHSTVQISHNYTYIPSSPHPSRSSQITRWCSLCYTASSHQLSFLPLIGYLCWCYFPHCVHKSTLYICIFPVNVFIDIFLDSIHLH